MGGRIDLTPLTLYQAYPTCPREQWVLTWPGQVWTRCGDMCSSCVQGGAPHFFCKGRPFLPSPTDPTTSTNWQIVIAVGQTYWTAAATRAIIEGGGTEGLTKLAKQNTDELMAEVCVNDNNWSGPGNVWMCDMYKGPDICCVR